MKNKLWDIKNGLEFNYTKFQTYHQSILNLLQYSDYITDANKETFLSILSDYNTDVKMFDEIFELFDRHERQIKILIQNDVGVLKKKREVLLTKIESQMKAKKNSNYDDLPF